MSDTQTLETLPHDLICEICRYLPTSDFRNIRFLCKRIFSKLPEHRLYRCRETIFFAQREVGFLKNIAARDPEQRGRIKHIVFDLSSPYVDVNGNTWEGISFGALKELSKSDFSELSDFCTKYTASYLDPRPAADDMAGSEDTLGSSNSNPSLPRHRMSVANQLAQSLVAQATRFTKRIGRLAAKSHSPPGLRDKISVSHIRRQLYRILRSALPCTINQDAEWTTPFDWSYHDAFFEALVETLKMLPNLNTINIRFRPDDLEDEDREDILAAWKRNNPGLEKFLAENLELTKFPWWTWVRCQYPDYSDTYYPDKRSTLTLSWVLEQLLSCTTKVQGSVPGITIKMKCLDAILRNDQVSFDEVFDIPPNRTFTQLSHIKPSDPTYMADVSRLKLDQLPLAIPNLLNNIECLILQGPEYHQAINKGPPQFLLNENMVMPKLRKLVLPDAILTGRSLLAFIEANSRSLEELLYIPRTAHCTTLEEFVEFMETLKRKANLKLCRIEVLTAGNQQQLCFLGVKTEGDWNTNGKCGYQVRVNCQTGNKVRLRYHVGGHGGQIGSGTWRNHESWEGFILGIQNARDIFTNSWCKCDMHFSGGGSTGNLQPFFSYDSAISGFW